MPKYIDPKLLQCLICKKHFAHLGSHIWHKHKIRAREYKEEFGLPYNMGLTTDEIKRKKSEHFEENREKYTKQLLKNSKQHQFKKGHNLNQSKRVSEYETEQETKRIKNYNKSLTYQNCPVCNMQYKHLASHLANKHNLKQI